ncbi:MAG: NAD(P)-dependent oxidoreductase [Dysgonamonadaceae bacterium]|jgi:nucleoside-diphosphate-sugar epimerase|nr:NAD(P)-dependent oxidoreductase [Dysgonamonadaceae bacterium]
MAWLHFPKPDMRLPVKNFNIFASVNIFCYSSAMDSNNSKDSCKKILITGASGFIGSFLVEEGLAKGIQVWANVRNSSSKEYLKDSRINFINLNFEDKEEMVRLIGEHASNFGKWDYVIHNAGVTKCSNTSGFRRVNFLNTVNFIEALKESGAIPEKFVLMSSLSARDNPISYYGKSKKDAEMFLSLQSGFPYVIIRPTGVYGPRDRDYFMKIKGIAAGIDFAAGLDTQILSFIYVKDLARFVFIAIESGAGNDIFVVSHPETYSDRHFADIIRREVGRKRVLRIAVPIFVLWIICALSTLYGKLFSKATTLNLDKFKIIRERDWSCETRITEERLGFMAEYDLERGLRETVAWYREKGWL